MSTALEIINTAYRRQNVEELSSFSTSQEFPQNLGLDLLNRVIRQLNRRPVGNFIFTETETALAYSGGTYTYSCLSNGIDPKRIRYIRKESTNHWGFLKQYNRPDFKTVFRLASVQTAEPTAWTKFNDTIELNTIPDADYSIKVTHFKDMPVCSLVTDSQTTGVILIPEKDEDILTDGVEAYLCEAMGKSDWTAKLQRWEQIVSRFVVDDVKDAGMPTQMPAMF